LAPAKRSAMPAIPKPDEDSKAFFASVVPEHPTVAVRPMFGNPAAFVNGNMFMGLFGPDVFVRLPEADREALEKVGGVSFEPMPGRRMTGYVVLPSAWRAEPRKVAKWVARSLGWAQGLPPKQPKPKSSKKR
jgi:TfoX/Sxy family transcriptional regulator of competence genes